MDPPACTVLSWTTLITLMATFGIASSSNQSLFSCTTDVECLRQGVENSSALLNVSRVCCEGVCVLESKCRSEESRNLNSTSLTNNTRTNAAHNGTHATVLIVQSNNTKTSGESLNSTTNSTDHNYIALCSTTKDCNSTKDLKYVCLSRQCVGIYPSSDIADECLCERAESPCQDGKCYNQTRTNEAPLISKQKSAITPLQLKLLFGTMGGIVVMIVIIYGVKTFTDNRRRRYLIKYGVWPDKDEKDDNEKKEKDSAKKDGNSETPGNAKKLPEVPIITVEMERELSTSSLSIQNDKSKTERKSENDHSKEIVSAQKKVDEKAQISPDMKSCIGEGNPRAKVTKPKVKINDKPIAFSPHNPVKETKKIEIKESPVLKRDKEFKIPDSPKAKFNVYSKGKDSPRKVMANGSPEKMSTLNRAKKGSPPAQLCEPENFSDYGM